MTYRILPALVLAFTVAACNSPKQETATEEPAQPEVKVEEQCTYSYDHSTSEVLWVAYKYTDKTGVKGVFDSVWVEGVASGNSHQDVLRNASFKIMTSSVNSGDPTRDPKIVESFFGTLKDSEFMTGTVTSIEGDGNDGKMSVELSMNGLTAPIEGTYSIVDDKFEFASEITVETWEAGGGIAKLNEVCSDLHKGSDGKSILWPDVSLYISTKLGKDCQEVASRD